MWRIGGLLALIGVAVLFLGSGSASAQGSADDLEQVDLTLITLPLDAMPSEFAGLQFVGAGFDPVDVRGPGEVNAYSILYINTTLDFFGALTAPALFADSAAAVENYNAAVQSFQDYYTNVVSTAITDLGDEAIALTGNDPNVPGAKVTIVLFRYGRMAAYAFVSDTSTTDRQAATETMARSLFARLKGVIAGDVTETSAPLPPDVNCDGLLDPVDAALMLQFDAGLVASLACGALGDANRDGAMNSIDASLLLQYSAGLVNCLPTGTTCAAGDGFPSAG